MIHRSYRRLRSASLVIALTATTLGSIAGAATLTDFKDGGFDTAFGRYAPMGDCKRSPVVTLDASGMTFTVGGQTQRSAKFEFAASFFGPDYSGISFTFFPFPISDYEPGHVLMYVNADEVEGKLALEENLGPGERLSPFEAALVKSSPLMRCRGS